VKGLYRSTATSPRQDYADGPVFEASPVVRKRRAPLPRVQWPTFTNGRGLPAELKDGEVEGEDAIRLTAE